MAEGNPRPKPTFTFKRPAPNTTDQAVQSAPPQERKKGHFKNATPKLPPEDPNGGLPQIPQRTRRRSMGNPDNNIPFPAPYWQDKLAKNFNLISELEKNAFLANALRSNPRLAEELMKHPDIAQEVARDDDLASKVVASPDLIRELALARYEMLSELKPYVPIAVPGGQGQQKVRVRRKSLDPNDEPAKQLRMGVAKEKSSSSSASSDEINASILSLASRATLPVISKMTMSTVAGGQFPRSINYLKDCNRLYLRHHIEITDGTVPCCDKKREYYDILNKYGKILYRAYQSRDRVFCSKYKLVIREPDGSPLIVMSKKYSLRNRHTLAVFCPETTYIGCVEQSWGLGTPHLILRNEKGDAMIQIQVLKRPFLSHFKYHPEFAFEIKTIGDRNIIGKISPEWLDLPPGIFPGKNIYGANFPKSLSAKVKMTVMAAWFLLYSLYYNGKFKKILRHNLSENERDLVQYIFEDPEDWRLKYDPSSDSILTLPAS